MGLKRFNQRGNTGQPEMHLAFLNPQGNFDPQDRYWTRHPDFGGQLVYVRQVALALGRMGHRVDILTRRIRDPQWPGLDGPLDGYPGAPGVRIIRIPAGPDAFLPKEELWPHIGPDWVPGILAFYRRESRFPDAFTAHYGDGGLAGALLAAETGIPFTFTAHSLGAQKMDGLGAVIVQNSAKGRGEALLSAALVFLLKPLRPAGDPVALPPGSNDSRTMPEVG
jgi:hypothetical protein